MAHYVDLLHRRGLGSAEAEEFKAAHPALREHAEIFEELFAHRRRLLKLLEGDEPGAVGGARGSRPALGESAVGES